MTPPDSTKPAKLTKMVFLQIFGIIIISSFVIAIFGHFVLEASFFALLLVFLGLESFLAILFIVYRAFVSNLS